MNWYLLLFLPIALQAKYKILDLLDEEAKVFDYLFEKKGYKKEIPATVKQRMVRNDTSNAKTVNITLTYAKLLALNELEQNFKVIAETFSLWEDERLTWDPTQFGGISMLMLKRDQIWIPDFVPYDLSDFDEPIPIERQMVIIFYNGTCGWYSSVIATFMCTINVADFPFDKQECAIKFSVYYSINSEIKLNGTLNPNYSLDLMGNNQWSATDFEIHYRNFEDAVFRWNYSEINFIFTLQRSDSYYVILIIIPSFVLTFLCVAGLFWTPVSSDTYMDKLNLGFAAILAMVFLLQITTDNIPKTSQVPILSVFSLINLSLITLGSLTVLVVGKYFSAKQQRNGCTKSGRFNLLTKNMHIILLLLYTCFTIINLVVLLSRKGRSSGEFLG